MLRLVGFFVIVLLSMRFLQALPGIGPWFHGLFGFWITAIVLSVALARLSGRLLERRRFTRRAAELGNVESAHNLGKLGALYLAYGKPKQALDAFTRSLESDPEGLETRYRRGQALGELRRWAEAIEDLETVARRDEEYNYGGVQLQLAEAYSRTGNPEAALTALERFDRNHGEKPESVYRRAQALRASGKTPEARREFGRVTELAKRGAAFQRRENAGWAARAFLARWF